MMNAPKKQGAFSGVPSKASPSDYHCHTQSANSRERIIADNPIVQFVRNHGHELKPAGRNFVTKACPVTQHKRGHRPVVLYAETQSWNCHDCKRGGSVIDWVMIEQNVSAASAMQMLGGGNNGSSELGDLVATYDYTDESGKLLYQCCRYEPKDFRQRRPDGKGGCIWNLDGVRRVLYRLPEVLKAQSVCVTEGEKDADNLCSLGFTATTNPYGAGKWRNEFTETLRGKDVVVFSDVGDEGGAGERHTAQVIQSLSGRAKSIKRMTLPDGSHDVSDYIASLPVESAEQTIKKLIEQTPDIAPTAPVQSEPQKRPSQADRLIKAADGREFFHTSDHRAYAYIPANGHKETIAVRSRKFRALLIRTHHSESGKVTNTARIEEAVAFFEGAALCGKELPVHTRLATHGAVIYLDLCNERWEAVEIAEDGWRVVVEPPVKFRRPRGMLALPIPTRGGSVFDLRPFVNVSNDDDFALLVAFMFAALRPGLPCPVEVLHGEQGSAKSTTAKVQKKLIDPTEPPLRSLPRDSRDLYIAASNSWIVALDNVSRLPIWLSDDLCRLAVGGGFATRELYSDDEEKIFSAYGQLS
jgi:hypothetical protein